MISNIIIGVLVVSTAWFWMRMRFWRWAARKRLGIIETQAGTIKMLNSHNADLWKRVAGQRCGVGDEWAEIITEREQ